MRSVVFGMAAATLLAVCPSDARAQAIGNFIEGFKRDFNETFRPNAVKPKYNPKPRASVISTSVRPQARPETDTAIDPALAGNAPLMAYRDAVLTRKKAEARFQDLKSRLDAQSNPRAIEDIYADLADLPKTTELGSEDTQALLDELAVAAGATSDADLTKSDVLRARQDLARAEIAVTEAREQLLPDEEVNDETIAVLHDMLGLSPVQ